jgi:hypothetical protein
VRLIIASSTRSGSIEVALAEAAKNVFEEVIDTAAKLRKALAPLTPTDGDFHTAFKALRVSNAKFARYYLRSLEMAAKKEREPWFVPHDDKQIINLEHVLPKKPEGNWPHFDEDEVRQLATRLGNLALMRASENSNMNSQEFAAKRKVYAASPYVLTSQIAEAQQWTLETIEDRQKKLADLAITTWPV